MLPRPVFRLLPLLLLLAPGCAGQAEAPPPARAAQGRELLELLQQAVQEKRRKDVHSLLRQARALADGGADPNVKGEQGRTPLHWIVIGTAQFTSRKVHREYRELAEILIDNQADVNAEDDHGNTPLDWEEANPEESLRYVLEQAGASHGTSHNDTQRIVAYLNNLRELAAKGDLAGLKRALNAGVPEGTEIRVRLTEPLHTKRARSGDRIAGVVIAPVRVNGRVVLEAHTKVEGTLLMARAARNRFTRAEASLDFTNFHHADGRVTRMATRVVEVDNARETVNYGRILGVPFPNEAVGRWTMGIRGLGFVLPGVSEGLRWSTEAYNRTLGREIDYPPGTELILRVAVPESLKTPAAQKNWNEVKPAPELIQLVRAQPHRVKTPTGEDSDIINLMFIGHSEDLEAGFREAGWTEAKNLGLRTGARTVFAALRKSGYEQAPFSRLQLDGRDPDYEYQKDLNTVAKRHHFRVYRRPETYGGQTVWVASSTHDIGIGVGRYGTQWYHLVDPEIDRERQKVADDLLFSGAATGYSLVERPEAPRKARNATGDELRTDGHMLVLYLTAPRKPAQSTPKGAARRAR